MAPIYTGQERRRFVRVDSRLPLQYKEIGSFKYTLTKDIGEGGVKFIAMEFIPASAKLILEISLSYPVQPIRAVAKVAWIQKMPYGDQYSVGMEFIDVAEENRTDIARYVKRNLPPFPPQSEKRMA